MNLYRIFIMTAAAGCLYGRSLSVTLNLSGTHNPMPWQSCISGKVSDPEAQVFVVVHPLKVSSYYIEPKPTVHSDGIFRAPVYFAEDDPMYNGERFEVRAVANPENQLHEGDTLASWPLSQSMSDVAEVIRSDGAPDGCGASAFVPYAPPPRASHAVAPSPVSPAERYYPARLWRCLLTTFGLLLFVALIIVPWRAQLALRKLSAVRSAVWAWWNNILLEIKNTFAQRNTVIGLRVWARALVVWGSRGNRLTFVQYITHVMAGPLMLIFFVLAFYADTRTLAPALGSYSLRKRPAQFSLRTMLLGDSNLV